MSAKGRPERELRPLGGQRCGEAASVGAHTSGHVEEASVPASHATDTLAARFAAVGLDWIVPRWRAAPNVQAFVTTRNGGVSTGTTRSLDLGDASLRDGTALDAAHVAENRRRVAAFLPAPPLWLEQVHGTAVVVADRARQQLAHAPDGHDEASHRRERPAPCGDAAVTRDSNVVLAIRIADCLPVLLADRGGTVIGIAHAGWRGLAAGVIENTVAAMKSDPGQIAAWLGPAIGRSAFEVGADVRDAFLQADAAAASAFVAAAPGKWLADLEALARMRLARIGVASVDGGGMCTASDPGRFFSWRRDRMRGRMAALIWRADPISRDGESATRRGEPAW